MSNDPPQDFAEWAVGAWSELLPEMDHSFTLFGLRIEQVAATLERAQKRGLRAYLAHGIVGIDDFRTLALIRRSGDIGISVTAIAEHLSATRGAISNRLDRLEREEMFERVYSDRDRRSHQIRLNSAGIELVDEMYRTIADIHTQLFSQLTEEQRAATSEGLLVITRTTDAGTLFPRAQKAVKG